MRILAADAMHGFGLWVEDIAAGTDGLWKASHFRVAADAMRTEQRLIPLVFPGSAPAAVEGPTEAAPPLAVPVVEDSSFSVTQIEPQLTELPELEPAPADEIALPEFSFDTEVALPAEPVEQEMSADLAAEFALDLGAAANDAPSVTEAPVNIDQIDLSGLADVTDSARPAEPNRALDPPPNDFSLSGLISELAPLPESPLEADTQSALGDEQIKVIGTLRIGIPLYNVYLNEADEWSRRLETEVSEWALELDSPLPDSTVGLAHALAGSSATVGFDALSNVARALEGALGKTQALVYGTPQHGKAFTAAAEEIRRLLHQFAAGFLKEPDPGVTEALHRLDELSIPKRTELLDEEIVLSGFGDLDAEAPAPVEQAPVAAPVTPPSVPHGPIAPAATMVVQQAVAAPTRNLDDEHDAIDVVDAIDADLFPIFEEEAGELLPQLGGALRQWVARPDNRGARDEVLRALHTLKGSARLAGALRLGEMSHRMESEIEEFGLEGIMPSDLESLLQRLDAMQANLDQLRASGAAADEASAAPPLEGVPTADAPSVSAPAASPCRSASRWPRSGRRRTSRCGCARNCLTDW